MVFSGVLSKVGAYGFLAIVLPLFPQASVHFQLLMLLIALCSIVYGSALAFTQTDARLIVGYSSVAQLGFITLGIFALNPQGAQGALLQMVNHGLVVARDPVHRRAAARRAAAALRTSATWAGSPSARRVLAALFLVVALATLAMPGLGQLRRRVPDPARRLQGQARDRDHRLQRRGDGERVRAAAVHPLDAQPRRREGRLARDRACATAPCSCRSSP